jgi:diguanylate cyclase (GGDEF) domain
MDGFSTADEKNNVITVDFDSMCRALCNFGIGVFRYFPEEKRFEVPHAMGERFDFHTSIGNMPYGFSDRFIYPEDRSLYNGLYERILAGEHTVSARVRSRDLYSCWKVTLTAVRWNEKGLPTEIIGIHENEAKPYLDEKLQEQFSRQFTDEKDSVELDEVMKIVSTTISTQYDALYHIWVKERKFIMLSEALQGVVDLLGKKGDYGKAWSDFIDNFVEMQDRQCVREFYDIETLPARLRLRDSISLDYRRIGTGWVRARYIVGKRDDRGEVTNVIFIVGNINDEIERERKQREDAYEAEHDSLTGLLNRKGFMRSINEEEFSSGKTGLILIDVDNFKAINDCHGHELGDQVLSAVADELEQAFRSDDRLFRLGGDEIGILLHDCGSDAWDPICLKIKRIHENLAKRFSEGLSLDVTLSAGICFSDTGYGNVMYQLADEALYETKKDGRAGCSLISHDHRIEKIWHDSGISVRTGNALQYLNSGMFRLEMPSSGAQPRLITGENTRISFGLTATATPEEVFSFWKRGVDHDYWPMLKKAAETMLCEGHADCTYVWCHPRYGKMYVRSNGFGEQREGITIISGFHHLLKDTKIIEKEDDKDLLFQALNDVYFASYYLDLPSDSLSILKVAPGEANLEMDGRSISQLKKEFVSVIVAPPDREGMLAFLDMSTFDSRLGEKKFLDFEYRSLELKSWCRAKLIPVKRGMDGKLTNVLFVLAALDSTKSMELSSIDYNRKSLAALFNNVPGGIVMYEWDGKKLTTLHISQYYKREYGDTLTGDDGGPDYKRIHPDDLGPYKKAVAEALEENNELHYTYRVWNRHKKCWLWVKIDAISAVQADGTSLIYAIYTDCTEQKRAEQKLENRNAAILAALGVGGFYIYEYDPVEHTSTYFSDKPIDFELDNIITDYPECFRTSGFMHSDDVEKFIATVHEIDNGAKRANCVIRVHKGEHLRWHSCSFDAFYNKEKGHQAAILTVLDVTDRMLSNAAYDSKLKNFDLISHEALSAGYINLNRNTYESVNPEKLTEYDFGTMPYVDMVNAFQRNIIGTGSGRRYRMMFDRSNLLEKAEKGEMHFQTDFLYRFSKKHTLWVEVLADLVRNPVNGEIEGLCYVRDVQSVKFSSLLMKNALNIDYPMMAVIVADTDEFYTLNTRTGTYETPRSDFWGKATDALLPIVSNMSREQLEKKLSREVINNHLKSNQEYRFSFSSNCFGQNGRVEFKCGYLTPSHSLLCASVRNITDEALLGRYKYESEHDALTGLLNRTAQFRYCRQLLDANPGEQYVMLHLDVKKFRLYNTFFGEEAGDRLLRKIALLFTNMGKDYDEWAYGRIESDVFCAFFPVSKGLFERHTRYFLHEMALYSEDFPLEFAIGAYYVTDPGMSIEVMFSRATIAAKSGRLNLFGIISRYDADMERELKENHQLTGMMQSAISEGQFQVYLQPKFSLRSGAMVGSEALVRWLHPALGMLSPGIFIPLFEKNGFITTLDRYMWERVCMLLRKWLDEGRTVLPVSVNISRVSFYSPATVSVLKSLVEKYNLEPRYLELELTESAYMDDPKEIKRMLSGLQSYGFKILMDDFGSGYSSLTALRELPVDVLKLDLRFLSESLEDSRAAIVLASVVRMSKLLALPIIAEGVETEKQAEYLKTIGCEFAQGVYFAKPMPVAEYEELSDKATGFAESPEKCDTELASRLLIAFNTDSASVANQFPVPLALIEYRQRKFIFARANSLFIKEFNITDDVRSASMAFFSHLPKEDYEKLVDGFSGCASDKCAVSRVFLWREDDGECKRFIANITHKGEVGYSDMLLVSFTAVPE